jgi:hypothetical protein
MGNPKAALRSLLDRPMHHGQGPFAVAMTSLALEGENVMPTSMILSVGRRTAQLLALTAALFGGPSPALAHTDGAYWHDAGAAAHNPQWMLTIAPGKTLTELSLPGTHDAGTYPGIGGDIAQTQTMTIREQLDAGIRYLDIRLRYYDGVAGRNCNTGHVSAHCALIVFHGIVPMDLLFERDVLRPTIQFLKNNPSETVLMRVAMEDSECDCDPGPATNELLRKVTSFDGGASVETYADYLVPSTCDDPGLLSLGPVRPVNSKPVRASCDARGKLVLMPQFFALRPEHHYRRLTSDPERVRPGIFMFKSVEWASLRTNFDLYDRLWLPAKQQLFEAGSFAQPQDFYFTGIGGSGGGFPYFFASGHINPRTGAARLSTGLVEGISADASTWPDFPRTGCAFGLCTISYEGMNILVADFLNRSYFKQPWSRVGIVSADFPGGRFITAVAGVNHGTTFNRPSFGYTLRTADGRPYTPGTWTNREVFITPVCSVACFGNRSVVSSDFPNGFGYTLTGGGTLVQFTASPIRVDVTPPLITAAASTPPNSSGWYTGNVVVHFTCADAGGSGIASCPDDQVLSKEGNAASAFQYAVDVAGNKSNTSNIVTVRIDKTPPVIVYRGNRGSYAPGQTIDIRCQALDGESGIASSTCADIRGPASSFGPGVHRFSATATDVAGHLGLGATSFSVVSLPGDANGDGTVDCRDQAVVKASFGKRAGMPGFDARADTNGDGVVDIRDLAFIAQRLPAGTKCP